MLGRNPEFPRCGECGKFRVLQPFFACAGIGAPRISENRLDAAALHHFAVIKYWRGGDLVRRENCRGDAGGFRNNERNIIATLVLNRGRHARRTKSSGGTYPAILNDPQA